MSRRVVLEDFYDPKQSKFEELSEALRRVHADPYWGAFFPKTMDAPWDQTKVMLLLVRLYEKVTGQKLLNQVEGPIELAQEMQQLCGEPERSA